jgi:hypothetical protein
VRASPPRRPPSPHASPSSPWRDSSARSMLLLSSRRLHALISPSMTGSLRLTPPSPPSSSSCPSSTRSSIVRRRRLVLHRLASSPPGRQVRALHLSASPTAPLGTTSISDTEIVDLGVYSPKSMTRPRVRSIPLHFCPILLPMLSPHRQ